MLLSEQANVGLRSCEFFHELRLSADEFRHYLVDRGRSNVGQSPWLIVAYDLLAFIWLQRQRGLRSVLPMVLTVTVVKDSVHHRVKIISVCVRLRDAGSAWCVLFDWVQVLHQHGLYRLLMREQGAYLEFTEATQVVQSFAWVLSRRFSWWPVKFKLDLLMPIIHSRSRLVVLPVVSKATVGKLALFCLV